jgi:hypothetical protein
MRQNSTGKRVQRVRSVWEIPTYGETMEMQMYKHALRQIVNRQHCRRFWRLTEAQEMDRPFRWNSYFLSSTYTQWLFLPNLC